MRRVLLASLVILAQVLGAGCGPSFDLRKAEKLMEKGRWDEADRLLDGVVESHAKSESGQKALMLKGCSLFKRSRYEEAETTLIAARDLLPEGKWADDCEYYLARVLFKRGAREEAVNGYRRVLTAYGDNPDRSNWKIRAMEEIEYIEKMTES